MELLEILDREAQSKDWLLCAVLAAMMLICAVRHTLTCVHMLQMFLNQNRSFERAPSEFALGVALGILWRSASLLLDANKHLGEEEALQFLPRLPVLANSNRAIKT